MSSAHLRGPPGAVDESDEVSPARGARPPGRGTKGQGARDTIPMGFEGGQLPLMQRIPKLRGFKNPFRIAYTPVNISALQAVDAESVDVAGFVALGLAQKGDLVKVLGGGELTRSVRVEAHAFSKAAESAITAAGGSVTVVPLPFGHDRPPAQGNALTNR